MANLTIKKFPEALLDLLRREAAAARRSLTQEVLTRLENSFQAKRPETNTMSTDSSPEDQARAWAALSGQWDSELTLEEEIEELYRARSKGRRVIL